MTTHNRWRWGGSLFLMLYIHSASIAAEPSHQPTLQPAFQQAKSMLLEGAKSQSRIDQTRSKTDKLLLEYRQLSQALQLLTVNHQQVKAIHRQQQESLDALDKQLSEVSKTENDIVPMLFSLIDWLDQWVSSDLPFYSEERQNRISRLKHSIVAPELSLSKRYRQVMEAYQIESEFGYSIDTYASEITLNEMTRQVNLLRIGRVGLFYESLDGKQGGRWEASSKSWQSVTDEDVRNIHLGILIARKQRPAALLALPLGAH